MVRSPWAREESQFSPENSQKSVSTISYQTLEFTENTATLWTTAREGQTRDTDQRARFLKCMMDINIVEWRGHVRMKAGRHVSTISPLNAFLVNIHSNS